MLCLKQVDVIPCVNIFIVHFIKHEQGTARKEKMMKKQNVIDSNMLLTTVHMQQMFGVVRKTVWWWRTNKAMPYLRIPGAGKDAIRFHLPDVVAWAVKQNRPIYWVPPGMEKTVVRLVRKEKKRQRRRKEKQQMKKQQG